MVEKRIEINMKKRRTLGLDIGTNSIGWALVETLEDDTKRIVKLGSRIVPMDGAEMSNFKRGLPQTKNAQRRTKKGIRVGNKRYKQRRNKLIYVLQKLNLLPDQIKLSEPFDNPLRIQKINVLPIDSETPQLTGYEFMQLRAQAIHKPVEAKEFGRILYHFNQLRGYAGGDDGEMEDELNSVLGTNSEKSYPSQENIIQPFKILKFEESDEPPKKGRKVFSISVLDTNKNEWTGTTLIENLIVGDILELKQTIRRNIKSGEVTSIEFSVPQKSSWRKKMENLEEALNKHSDSKGRKTYISEYLLECLEDDKWLKIRDNVILRSRYVEEFEAIWNAQFDAHLKNIEPQVLIEIANFLFPGASKTQQKLREQAIQKGIKYIVRDQIIYFQRPLKDQSHLISECRFEEAEKAVPNSHPLFQEYRIWEQINKLSINRRVQVGFKKDGSPKYIYQERSISSGFKEFLFKELQEKKELNFASVFISLKRTEDFKEGIDFFNGMSSKSKLVGNSTRLAFKKQLGRFWDLLEIQDINNQIELWELLYYGKGNEYDIESPRNIAILKYLKKHSIQEATIDKITIAISCIKFPRNYQSLSLKAVKKVLPLVRAGKYFDANTFPNEVKQRVIKLLNEHSENPFDKSVESYLEANGSQILENGGFINAYALMLVYGQHTAKEIGKGDLLDNWNEVKPLGRHSLRNPLVEQMINETLMVVKDIWKRYGRPEEIKVELSRDLKNSKKERERIHESNEKSRKKNDYAKKRLLELNQELSAANIEKYRLWDEQNHIDPYTGQTIQLTDLFNKGLYDIDHIIPQSRYFDDSLGNKVVCAKVINKDKGNRTAMEYFDVGSSKFQSVLLPKEVFMDNAVNKFYGKKRKNMLATKIPENPIERQKKETQYISIRVREELSKIVGSKNVKTSAGGITHYLRNHWGLTPIFKQILKDRFIQFFYTKAEIEFNNLIKGDQSFSAFFIELANSNLPPAEAIDFIKNSSVEFDDMTLETFKELYVSCHVFFKNSNLILKGYSKRFDHRHHAMDALIVACTDERSVKRLNDLNKYLVDWIQKRKENGDLNFNPETEDLLEEFLGQESEFRNMAMSQIEKFRKIEMPWPNFIPDTKKALNQILVSHKPKDKLLVQQKEEKNEVGTITKSKEKTIRIRGGLHEDTIYGLTNGMESYRVPLSKFSNNSFDTAGNIEKIVNEFLRVTIRQHFTEIHNNNKVNAFGAEGLLGLNRKLAERKVVKNGISILSPHPPIHSVKVYRKKLKEGSRYKISLQRLNREKSFNKNLYVNSGSNYQFAVLKKNESRVYDIISLFDAADLVKDSLVNSSSKDAFDKDQVFKNYFEEKNKAKLLFCLKQLDLIYLPGENEEVIFDHDSTLFKSYWLDDARLNNIYIVTKFSGSEIYFNHHSLAEVIEKKIELKSQDMIQTLNGRRIVEFCFPIKIDRLGNIQSFVDLSGNNITVCCNN